MSDYGSDDYDYERDRDRERRRRPSAHRHRSDRRSTHLAPDTNGLYRTRSQGHAPVPSINIYNDMQQEGSYRSSSRSPDYPPSPRGRRLGDDLADDYAELALENRRLRSRSRGRSDASSRRDDYIEWKLRDERVKQEYEIDKAKEDAEKKSIIAEYERKRREEEDERKEEEKRLRDKIEREKIEAKEKEEREWNEFLRKQREKEEDEKRKKKEEEERVEEEMRKRLSKNGYTYDQIERMIRDEKDEKSKTVTTTTLTTTRSLGQYRPTYAKVHRDFLSVDTLKYYDIPYEWYRDDPNYIIILREMDKYETEVLFEHTRRLRAGKLLLEPAKEQKQYAWYRKRDRSTSRVRKVGILEFKK